MFPKLAAIRNAISLILEHFLSRISASPIYVNLALTI
jgi:hypothetical protein